MKLFTILPIFLIFAESCLSDDGGLRLAALGQTNKNPDSLTDDHHKPALRTNFTGSQIDAVINKFNARRKALGAKYMETVAWNYEMGYAFDPEVRKCRSTGTLPVVPAKPGQAHDGLQYRYYTGASIDVTNAFWESVVDALYSYGMYYDYDENKCNPDHLSECEMYRYAAEATASEIGCAYEECLTIDGIQTPPETVLIGCLFSYSSSAKVGIDRPYEKSGSSQIQGTGNWAFLLLVAILQTSTCFLYYR